MSILRDFERRLEGAVEGFFARAFRSGLQPVELAKAVQRYPGNYQQVGIDGIIVPNVYRFTLSPDDLERFGGYVTALQRELADVVVRTAAERGWQLKGPVRIEFTQRDDVRVGTYELRGKIEARADERRQVAAPPPAPVAAADDAAPAAAPGMLAAAGKGETRVLPAQAPAALLRVVGGDEPARRLRDAVTLGRLPDCDVRLEDPSVSRRHARLAPAGVTWHIEDLGSTNGVKVNGQRVSATELRDGDRIELGSVRLAFSLEA